MREVNMTDEVIYKKDAIEAIRNVKYGGSAMRKVLFIKALENVPPAQPERKMGHWIEKDDGWDGVYYECSVCGEPYTLIDGLPSDNKYNFCPNCGTDMGGEQDEQT